MLNAQANRAGAVSSRYICLCIKARLTRKPRGSRPKTRPRGNETILLVDDEEALRNMAAQILQGMGYTVLTAQSGEEALEIFKEKMDEVDLVVSWIWACRAWGEANA